MASFVCTTFTEGAAGGRWIGPQPNMFPLRYDENICIPSAVFAIVCQSDGDASLTATEWVCHLPDKSLS